MEEAKTEHKIKGRTWTQLTTFLSVVVLIVCSLLKWFGKMPGAEIGEIIAVCVAINAPTVPIDINMLVDKFKKNKE